MKKNNIILDADGVLLDTLPYFLRWLFLNVPNFDIKKLLNKKIIYLLEEFGNNYEAFSSIPPMKHSIEMVEYLSDKYDIDVITSYGGSELNNKGREDNIKKYFGKYINDIIILPFDYSKKSLYADYPHETIVVDDDIRNCQEAQSLSLKTLWFQYYAVFSPLIHHRTRSKTDKQILQITSLKEIQKYL